MLARGGPRATSGNSVEVLESRVIAGIQAFSGVIMLAIAFGRWSDHGEIGVGLWAGLSSGLLALLSLILLPRLPWWGADVFLALTGAIFAVCALGSPSDAGQLTVGIGLVLLGVFAGYFMSRRRMAIQLFGLIGLYCVALILNPMLESPVYVVTVAVIVIVSALGVNELAYNERLARERYRLLAENTSDVVMRIDTSDTVTWVSRAAQEVLGWNTDYLLGRGVAELIYADDLPTALPWRALHEPVSAAHGTMARFLRADGQVRFMSMSVQPIIEVDGSGSGAVIGLRDIDSVVRANEDVARAWRSAEEAHRKTDFERALLQSTLNASPDAHALVTAVRDSTDQVVDFNISYVNDAGCVFLGRARAELVGVGLLTVMPSQVATSMFSLFVSSLETGRPLTLDDFPGLGPSGVERWYDIRAVPVGNSLSVSWRDVSERYSATRALAMSEIQYRLLAENSADVVARIKAGAIVWISPSILKALGWHPDELVGRQFSDLLHAEDVGPVESGYEAVAVGASVTYRSRMVTRDNVMHWVEIQIGPYRSVDGDVEGAVVSFRIIDDRVAAQQELDRRARFDELTGLLNRAEVMERMVAATDPRRTGVESALLFCDVDHFKLVNDTYGHAAGDEVLRTVADRVTQCVRSGDLAARMGGDEVLVMLRGIHSVQDAMNVAEKIRAAVAVPIAIGANEVTTTMSIGVTVADPRESVDQLIARADSAMYLAKQSGRNRVVSIDSEFPSGLTADDTNA